MDVDVNGWTEQKNIWIKDLDSVAEINRIVTRTISKINILDFSDFLKPLATCLYIQKHEKKSTM